MMQIKTHLLGLAPSSAVILIIFAAKITNFSNCRLKRRQPFSWEL